MSKKDGCFVGAVALGPFTLVFLVGLFLAWPRSVPIVGLPRAARQTLGRYDRDKHV